MKFKHILISIILIVVVGVLGYFIGAKVAYDRYERALDLVAERETQTFYGTVIDLLPGNPEVGVYGILHVKGLEVNDINYRGEFTGNLADKTKLTWRGTDISLNDLNTGDRVSITYEGLVKEIHPAQIDDVIKIQLLEDEK